MLDLKTLNENQRAAVEWDTGPLLVLAGPGSGKTRVLTFRIARLLQASEDQRYRILGITFTNKAAAEMRQRLDELLKVGRERALLTTFHSFAAELLRQHGSHLGLKPDFTIQSQTADRQAVLAESIKAVGDEDQQDQYPPERMLAIIDAILDEGFVVDEVEKHLEGVPDAPFIASVYMHYFSNLIRSNQMDFGTLIVSATGLLKGHPGVAKQVRRIYKHVCVDEFQDTNASQFKFLLQLLPESGANLFVVADDDQVIYQWNGADPKRLGEICSRYKMKTIQLPQNYRCPKEVIDLANKLISHNLDRAADKMKLTSSKPASRDAVIRLKNFDDLDAEVAWIREDISGRPATDQSKCVLLARTRKLLETAVLELSKHGLPAHVSVKKNEFQSAPLRWLHAMLRLANARTDREQVRRVCKAFYQLEGINVRVEEVVAGAPLNGGDFLKSWTSQVLKNANLASKVRLLLQDTSADLAERGDFESFTENTFQWFEGLKAQPGAVPIEAFNEYDEEAACWRRLVEEVYSELGRSEVTLSSLLQGFDLRSKEPPAPKGAIFCYTIHTAKGMEFEHVYLMGMAEDQLPSWAAVKKGEDSLEMREERRNCFVAITRTQATLTLTYSDAYNGWSKKPSRFLYEMGLLS